MKNKNKNKNGQDLGEEKSWKILAEGYSYTCYSYLLQLDFHFVVFSFFFCISLFPSNTLQTS